VKNKKKQNRRTEEQKNIASRAVCMHITQKISQLMNKMIIQQKENIGQLHNIDFLAMYELAATISHDSETKTY
jgi:hypothetical protein